jgi:large subunit ribosomal protein L25
MKIVLLKGEVRTESGSASSRRLRRAGRIPGVVYGLGKEPQSFAVDAKTLEHEIHEGHRAFKFELAGDEQAVLLQDLQYDVVGEGVVHVDFRRIDLTKKVVVKVPLVFTGMPEMVSGGVVDRITEDVEVECLPADIPASIEILLSGMTIGTHIEGKDVPMPANVTFVGDPHATIVSFHYKAAEAAPAETAEAAEATAQPEMLKEKKDEGAEGEKKDAKK